MKNILRTSRVLIPWLSLAWPVFLVVSMGSLKSLYPNLFCVALDSGGKEFICGSDYSHPVVRFVQGSGLIVWALLLIAAGTEVFRRKTTRAAIIPWSVSVLLFVSMIVLSRMLYVECTP